MKQTHNSHKLSKMRKRASPSPASPAKMTKNSFLEEQGFIDTLYEPHTLTAGAILLSVIIYAAFWGDHSSPVANTKLGELPTKFIVYVSWLIC